MISPIHPIPTEAAPVLAVQEISAAEQVRILDSRLRNLRARERYYAAEIGAFMVKMEGVQQEIDDLETLRIRADEQDLDDRFGVPE